MSRAIRLPMVLFLGAALPVAVQAGVAGPTAAEAIRAYFERNPSRLQRANGLKVHGATLDQVLPTPAAAEAQRSLAETWEREPFDAAPGNEVLLLAHEVAAHSPGLAVRMLRRIATRPCNSAQGGLLRVALLAAGAEGEALCVELLLGGDDSWRSFAGMVLATHAVDLQTGEALTRRLAESAPGDSRPGWFRPLAAVGFGPAREVVLKQIQQASRDELQAEAIWTYAELNGFEGIGPLASLKPLGPRARKELEESLAWLRKETSARSPHGVEMASDREFVARFADLRTPSMQWLASAGLLSDGALEHPRKLGSKEVDGLLAQLTRSQAFGLEACKGALFLSVGSEHEGALRKLCTVNWWSPDDGSQGRGKTLAILLRKIRYEGAGEKSR